MPETILLLVLIQGILIGALCSFVASQKNRGAGSWFILGFIFSLLALIALAAIPSLPRTSKTERGPSPQKGTNELSDSLVFLGVKDLDSDEYRIWLADRYKIIKNEALGGIICDKKIFATIDAALAHANSHYLKELALIKSEEAPTTGVKGAVFWLKANGFIVERLENEKWMVAKRSKKISKSILAYPNSDTELIKFAAEKSGKSFSVSAA